MKTKDKLIAKLEELVALAKVSPFAYESRKWNQLESEIADIKAEIEQEQKAPSDKDIENAAADYINEPEQTWNTADYLHIADAYEQGAKDCRDNKIYISPK